GGGHTYRSVSPARSGNGRADGGYVGRRVMTVAQMDQEDENDEFERVYEIHVAPKTANQMRDCPFFVWFTSREEKDRQRQAFGSRCLNCGSD
ncbi:unnamed protein product, partial [Ectocarpus fasciculatus]